MTLRSVDVPIDMVAEPRGSAPQLKDSSMPAQNSNHPDGAFPAQSPVQSGPFGVVTGQNPGTNPGSKQADIPRFGKP